MAATASTGTGSSQEPEASLGLPVQLAVVQPLGPSSAAFHKLLDHDYIISGAARNQTQVGLLVLKVMAYALCHDTDPEPTLNTYLMGYMKAV